MLLITGPTGNVGAELIELFDRTAGDSTWRVAARHPDAIPASSAQTVHLDFLDHTTWPAALDGVTTLFLLFPLPANRTARAAIVPFVTAAERAGCRHVVYVSVFGADRARFIPHHLVETAIMHSGMSWTVLRCSFFMQNLHRRLSTHGIDIVDRGELFIPAGGGRTTFLDARDAAAVAADALRHPDRHRNTVHHLTGPSALTMDEVATALADALGRPVRYTSPGVLAFARRLRTRDVDWKTIGFMSAVYTLTRFGLNQPLTDDVARLLGRPPRALSDFLADSSWRWRDRAWT